jgi:hypothetical protein
MADQGSGDFRPGRDRAEEESPRGSVREGGDSGAQGYADGREGYSEPVRGERERGNEQRGQQGLYGQGRRPEESWRPGQSESSEGGSQSVGQSGSQYGQGGESQTEGGAPSQTGSSQR